MNAEVTVCIICFNQKNYIEQAIDSVLSQKTNFCFDILIADDHSTDGTSEVIQSYKNRLPEKINLLIQEKNVGPAKNWISLICSPRSKYIAYLDGDDYWTDELKLQKQYDFLESSAQYSLVAHKANVIYELGGEAVTLKSTTKTDVRGKDILRKWIIPSSSIMFRNCFDNTLPEFFKTATHGDFAFFLFMLQWGKIRILSDFMSVYRINSNGVTQSGFCSLDHNLRHIHQLEMMKSFFGSKHRRLLNKRLSSYYLSSAIYYAKNSAGKKAFQCCSKAVGSYPLFFLNYPRSLASVLYHIIFSKKNA